MLDEETPLLFPEQTILFLRTNPTLQALFTEEEKEALAAEFRLHELGELSNICVDYTRFLNVGFPGMRSRLEAQKNKFVSCGQMEKAAYLEGQLTILKALESLILRYRDAASDAGNTLSADSLTHLLSDAPHTLQDALQMQRIIHFTMWCAGNYHNTPVSYTHLDVYKRQEPLCQDSPRNWTVSDPDWYIPAFPPHGIPGNPADRSRLPNPAFPY